MGMGTLRWGRNRDGRMTAGMGWGQVSDGGDVVDTATKLWGWGQNSLPCHSLDSAYCKPQ